MAHHVGRELAGEAAAVRETPQQLRGPAPVPEPYHAQVGRRVILHVFKILARARYQKILPFQRRGGEARGNGAQDVFHIQIFLYVLFVQQHGDIASVALVPAVGVHVGAAAHQLRQPGRRENVFHALSS